MIKGPRRLMLDDSDFARLIAASESEEPGSDQIDSALSLADRTAAASGWNAWRWFSPRLVIGAAAIGASVLALVSISAHSEPTIQTHAGIQNVTMIESAAPIRASETPLEPVTDSTSAPRASAVRIDHEPPPKAVAVTVPAALPSVRVASQVGSPRAKSSQVGSPRAKSTPSLVTDVVPQGGASRTTFSEELALVSVARSALEGGDFASCMRAVDRYDEKFRSGLFAHEIEVIRIEALATSGERERAAVLAERFLAANASSPYADLVRSFLAHDRD
ncbi:hypothetical protein AKJ09_06763 [Labilithrix luteola]|uniref:Uncharacterized protein n=1 Tax=Labilithrix luteola TaxID=1391654 RepID=A0A0K1Q3Y6_9BACT|nr:hypothetical protein [Labilithrix luteola]AKV00100.1 hypothetical protein AKJ09_06763 [Labilithrix luteola]